MKKYVSILLATLMVLTVAVPLAAAAGTDVNGHWAQEDIEYLNEKGIMKGYPDGTFRPDNRISKAEYITLVNRTFGLSATGTTSYPDVPSGEWYSPEISKAEAAGYLFTFSGKVNPEKDLTREEAAAMFGRLLSLDGGGTSSFSDASKFSSWSAPYIAAVADAGIINGYPDGTFRPKDSISRAEVARVVCNVVGSYYDAAGSYTPVSAGPVTVAASGVTLQNATIPGDLYITGGAKYGTVTLNNVTVGGRIVAVGDPGCTVVLGGSSGSVAADCDGLKLRVSGTVGTLTLSADSGTAGAEIADGGRVENLVMNSAGSVTGSGSIGKAVINANGVTASMQPKEWTLKAGVTAVLSGKTVTASGTAGPGFAEGYPTATLLDTGMGSADIRIRLKTDRVGRVYAIVVPRDSASPTAAQVKAMQSYGYVSVLRGNMLEMPAASTETSLTLASLSSSTLYDVWIVAEDGSLTLGEPVKLQPTQSVFAADYPRVYSASGTTASVEVKTVRPATVYWAAVPKQNTAPTAQQLISQTGLGAVCGTKTLQAGVADFITVGNLTGSISSYTFYIVTKDIYGTVDPQTPDALDLSAAENSMTAVYNFQPTNNEYPPYTSVTLTFSKDMYKSGTATPISFIAGGLSDCISISGQSAVNGTKIDVAGCTLVPTSNRTVTITPPAGGWSTGMQYTISVKNFADENGQAPTPSSVTFATSGGQSLVAAPTASPASGVSVLPGSYITLSSATANATIQYTVYGNDPRVDPYVTGPGAQTVYQVPENQPNGTTINLRAVAKYNNNYSETVNLNYIIGMTTAAPEANVASGSYVMSGTYVTLSCQAAGATIFYTTDGSTPSISSPSIPAAGGNIYITGTAGSTFTVKALAIVNGTSSVIRTFTYYIGSGTQQGTKPAAPLVYAQSSGGGSYVQSGTSCTLYAGSTVGITSQATGTVLYYTLDGSDPTVSPTRLGSGTQSVTLAAASFPNTQCTLKAVAYNTSGAYWQNPYSDVVTVYLYIVR